MQKVFKDLENIEQIVSIWDHKRNTSKNVIELTYLGASWPQWKRTTERLPAAPCRWPGRVSAVPTSGLCPDSLGSFLNFVPTCRHTARVWDLACWVKRFLWGGLVVGFGMPFSFAAGISFLKDHGRPPRKPLYVKDTLLFLDGLMCEDTSAPIRSMFALGMFKVWGVAFPLYLGNPRSSDHSWVWNGCAFPLGLLDKAGQESFPQVLFLSDRQFNMRVENGDREMSSEFLMWYLQVESVKWIKLKKQVNKKKRHQPHLLENEYPPDMFTNVYIIST